MDRLEALAGELIGQKVDVIVVGSSQGAHATQQATKTIAIVMAGVANAVGAGLVASLAKPGSNITGFTSQQDEVLGKLIGILHEVAPGARRIAILLNDSNPLHAAYWAGAQSAVAGGLLGYGYDAAGNYRNAAKYVDLPVEQATKFELVINLKTAKTLGLTIPQSLLLRADEVIQ